MIGLFPATTAHFVQSLQRYCGENQYFDNNIGRLWPFGLWMNSKGAVRYSMNKSFSSSNAMQLYANKSALTLQMMGNRSI